MFTRSASQETNEAPPTSGTSSLLAPLWGMLGYKESEDTQVTLRNLADVPKRTFERIIEAINGDTYVYSNNLVKSYASLGKDGTLVWEYIATLDPLSIEFEGRLTDEQVASAGLHPTAEPFEKATLIKYLVSYCHKNQGKFKPEIFELIVKTLIEKKAVFDLDMYKKCRNMGIDIAKLWSATNTVDVASCSVDDILKATPEMLKPLLHSYFYNKPIEDIFPSTLGDERLDNYISLFVEAIEERIALIESKKIEPKNELNIDLSFSKFAVGIVDDANMYQEMTAQKIELAKLTYALNTAVVRISADSLLASEQELAKLLDQKNAKDREISKIELHITGVRAEIEREQKKLKEDGETLLAKKVEFARNWPSNPDTEQTSAFTMAKNLATQNILSEQQTNAIFSAQLKQKELNLRLSESTLGKEKVSLTTLDGQIVVAEAIAVDKAKHYNELVSAQKQTYEDLNSNTLFRLPKCTKLQYQELGKDKNSYSLRRLFCENCVYYPQKKSLFFSLAVGQKWNCIHPLFQNGLLLEGAKSVESKETVAQILAKKYTETAAQEIILMLAHTHPEVMQAIVDTKKEILDCANQFFTATPAYMHLKSKAEHQL